MGAVVLSVGFQSSCDSRRGKDRILASDLKNPLVMRGNSNKKH